MLVPMPVAIGQVTVRMIWNASCVDHHRSPPVSTYKNGTRGQARRSPTPVSAPLQVRPVDGQVEPHEDYGEGMQEADEEFE